MSYPMLDSRKIFSLESIEQYGQLETNPPPYKPNLWKKLPTVSPTEDPILYDISPFIPCTRKDQKNTDGSPFYRMITVRMWVQEYFDKANFCDVVHCEDGVFIQIDSNRYTLPDFLKIVIHDGGRYGYESNDLASAASKEICKKIYRLMDKAAVEITDYRLQNGLVHINYFSRY